MIFENASKRLLLHLKTRLIKAVWGYGKKELVNRLRDLGVRGGDTIMAHCGFSFSSGFNGSPQDVIEALQEAVGESGTLIMMTMPYHNMSSFEYLQQHKVFDARRTVSMVGIVTEVFRRRPDVLRNAHPTHPSAAWGKNAEWIISGESPDLSPFGDNTVFDRLVQARGNVLLYNVPFNSMTFEHYLEHRIQASLPVPLYRPTPISARVIDRNGQYHNVKTLTLSDEIHKCRDSQNLARELAKRGALKQSRLGRSSLILAYAVRMVETVTYMAAEGRTFHFGGHSPG